MTTNISLFQGKTIRKTFHGDEWWFSVVDVVGALTDSVNPRDYWFKMKARVQAEDGFEPSTVCRQMKLSAEDGKMRETDCANIEGIFRIIQSIPSPKAEPFKLWLAKAGYERVQEIADPERSVDRARENWQKHGRSEKWIQQRMTGQETRNKLTDYWSGHGVKKGDEFAVLTNIIHEEWSGLTVRGHKNIKGLRSQNLRDHMNEAELIFTALAELSTRQIAETMQAEGFEKNKLPAKKGGQIAKDARKALEDKTGKSVVSEDNFLPPGTSKKRVKYLT
ncbi:antirepressor [Candidatus Peribacteria bacterium RIFCSPLOWO2_01_FULL_51_18]|nr:MAG: antirepressor [Candidatus Peribacteria bacterium RIFCSPHIGHO2_02_FULL_51_15]OGJ66496.1 MAG: antirepressor [Candidatus Peribacteria bacterium RIFCSPLOWO2_01_FULL_51_18]